MNYQKWLSDTSISKKDKKLIEEIGIGNINQQRRILKRQNLSINVLRFVMLEGGIYLRHDVLHNKAVDNQLLEIGYRDYNKDIRQTAIDVTKDPAMLDLAYNLPRMTIENKEHVLSNPNVGEKTLISLFDPSAKSTFANPVSDISAKAILCGKALNNEKALTVKVIQAAMKYPDINIRMMALHTKLAKNKLVILLPALKDSNSDIREAANLLVDEFKNRQHHENN